MAPETIICWICLYDFYPKVMLMFQGQSYLICTINYSTCDILKTTVDTALWDQFGPDSNWLHYQLVNELDTSTSKKSNLGLVNLVQFDPINRMIPLTLIPFTLLRRLLKSYNFNFKYFLVNRQLSKCKVKIN